MLLCCGIESYSSGLCLNVTDNVQNGGVLWGTSHNFVTLLEFIYLCIRI
jgi:hypothetical protein